MIQTKMLRGQIYILINTTQIQLQDIHDELAIPQNNELNN